MPYCEHFTQTLTAAGFRAENGQQQLHCPHCDFVLYENGKVTVGVIVSDGTKVLIGKRVAGHVEAGRWDTPGGFLEMGEHPETAGQREVREETGLEVQIKELLGIFEDPFYNRWTTHLVCIFYQARVTGGTLSAGDDLEELRWVELSELPEDMAFNGNRCALNLWLRRFGLPPRYQSS